MSIRREGDYWVDRNNNKWSVAGNIKSDIIPASKAAAEILSKSLHNCRDCIDCRDSSFSVGCKRCARVHHCVNCDLTQDCSFCTNCERALICSYCTNCINITACHYIDSVRDTTCQPGSCVDMIEFYDSMAVGIHAAAYWKKDWTGIGWRVFVRVYSTVTHADLYHTDKLNGKYVSTIFAGTYREFQAYVETEKDTRAYKGYLAFINRIKTSIKDPEREP